MVFDAGAWAFADAGMLGVGDTMGMVGRVVDSAAARHTGNGNTQHRRGARKGEGNGIRA